MKKFLCLLLSMTLMSSMVISASAADFEPDYYGKSGMEVVCEGGKLNNNVDLRDGLNELQPGDTMQFTVNIRNSDEVDTTWYLTNEVTQAFEESTEASGGAYTYMLTYNDEVLYRSLTVGGEDTSGGVGLKEATNALKEQDMYQLDTLSQGETGVITLTVGLDGETQGNDYQNAQGDLQLVLAVEMGAVDNDTPSDDGSTSDPEKKPKEKKKNKKKTKVVKTGDERDLTPFFTIASVSGVLLLLLAAIGLKKSNEDEE